jgi:endo-alpha-1,4-polygalactosaminidase (GH114 family)
MKTRSSLRAVAAVIFSMATLGLIGCGSRQVGVDASQGSVWQPAPETTWQWQLSGGPINQDVDAQVFDIDLFDNPASVVASLHAKGRKVIAYISAGSYENWRPDKSKFLAHPEVLGKNYAGWAGEKWVDIRCLDILGPIMKARMDRAKRKGFDALEPDNIDGYQNDTGFPLTYADQITYNTFLARAAHARGLSIGLKNDPDQVGDLLSHFDWALVEDCFADKFSGQLTPFIAAGKAVFAAEYTDTGITRGKFCPKAKTLRFSAILKHRNLDAWRRTCP